MPDFYPPDWWSSRLHLFQAIATLQLDLLHYSTQPWNDKMASQQDLIGEGTTYLKSLITAAGGGSADGSPLLTTLATLKEMIFSRRSAAASNNPPSIASSSRSGIPQRESNERNSPTLRAASSIAGTATSSSSSSSLSAARAGGGGNFSKDPTQGIPALPAPLNNNPSNSVLLSSSPPLHQSQHYMSSPQMNRPFQPQPPNFNGTYSNSPQLSDSNHSRYGSSSMYLDPQIQPEPPISPHETDAFISILDNVMRGSAQGGINNPSMSNMSNSLGGGGGGHTRSSSSLEAAMPTESMRARSQSHSNSSSYELRGGQHTYNSLSQQQQQHHQHHQNSFQTHPNRAFTWGAEHHQAERNQQNQNQNSSPYQ